MSSVADIVEGRRLRVFPFTFYLSPFTSHFILPSTNVLVIAPHPDDEAIGCGGAVCIHRQEGHHVSVVFLTSGERGLQQLPRERAWRVRENEARRSARILGLEAPIFLRLPDWELGCEIRKAVVALGPVLEQHTPEIIYLPHPAEWHPDHKVVLSIVRRALRKYGASPELRGYEIWTPLTEPDFTTDISAVMNQKIRALRAHASQIKQLDYVRAVRGINAYRGTLSGNCMYAEAFKKFTPRSEKAR